MTTPPVQGIPEGLAWHLATEMAGRGAPPRQSAALAHMLAASALTWLAERGVVAEHQDPDKPGLLTCAVLDCPTTPIPAMSGRAARQVAEQNGWRQLHGIDLCQLHALVHLEPGHESWWPSPRDQAHGRPPGAYGRLAVNP